MHFRMHGLAETAVHFHLHDMRHGGAPTRIVESIWPYLLAPLQSIWACTDATYDGYNLLQPAPAWE